MPTVDEITPEDVAGLQVGGTLPAFTLLERGDLTKITVHSFSAGTASAGLENENADTATRALRSLRSELSADFEICKKVRRPISKIVAHLHILVDVYLLPR